MRALSRPLKALAALLLGAASIAACELVTGVDDLEVLPGAVCFPGDTRPCYSGDETTKNQGICVEGIETCADDGSGFGACEGEVLPAEEDCETPEDEDCDGQTPACTCDDPPCECENPPCDPPVCDNPPCDPCINEACGATVSWSDAFGTGIRAVGAGNNGVVVTGGVDELTTYYFVDDVTNGFQPSDKIFVGFFDLDGTRLTAIDHAEQDYDDALVTALGPNFLAAWDGIEQTNNEGKIATRTYDAIVPLEPIVGRNDTDGAARTKPAVKPRTAIALNDAGEWFFAATAETSLFLGTAVDLPTPAMVVYALRDPNPATGTQSPAALWPQPGHVGLTSVDDAAVSALTALDDGRVVLGACVTTGYDGLSAACPTRTLGSDVALLLTLFDGGGACIDTVEVSLPNAAVIADCDARLAPMGAGFALAATVTGTFEIGSDPPAPIGTTDVVLVTFDQLARPVLTLRFGEPGKTTTLADVVQRPDGRLVLGILFEDQLTFGTLSVSQTTPGDHLALVDIDPQGNVLAVRVLEGLDASVVRPRLAPLPDGRLAITGRATTDMVYQPTPAAPIVHDIHHGFIVVESALSPVSR